MFSWFQALGNHEFDDGVAGLIPYILAMKAPVLAANLVASNDSGLYGLYRNNVILQKKGRRIGIIGLITKNTEVSVTAKKNLIRLFFNYVDSKMSPGNITCQEWKKNSWSFKP